MNKSSAVNVIVSIALAATTLVAVPAIAADPGANPAGNWVCFAAGASEPMGMLTMTNVDYAFAPNGVPVSAGTYRIERNVITLTSGPLEDDLGLSHGFFNTAANPVALTFDTAAGRGMTCKPDVDL